MKIFEGDTSSWSEKVNFVDEKNVFVGYDMGQSCCEEAGWFISSSRTDYTYDLELPKAPDVDAYRFDTGFKELGAGSSLDGGGMIIFKLVADGMPDLFLHIYNSHNGYYSHGFEIRHGDKLVEEDYL